MSARRGGELCACVRERGEKEGRREEGMEGVREGGMDRGRDGGREGDGVYV